MSGAKAVESPNIDIIDKNNGFIYPALKSDYEKKMSTQKDDIVPLSAESVSYFSFAYRLQNGALNALAKKYDSNADDDEICLLGPQACSSVWKSENLRRVREIVEERANLTADDICGIYLPEIDRNDGENRQQFLLLGRNYFYARYEDMGLKRAPYGDLLFTREGAIDRRKSPNSGEYAEYFTACFFPENFLSYALELSALHVAKLSGIRVRHPVTASPADHKRRYLEFLVHVGANGGKLTLVQLLRLEYLAREFMIPAEDLSEWLRQSISKKKNSRSWERELTNIVRMIPEELRYVFFKDVLSMTIGTQSEMNCPEMPRLLERPAFAGKEFTAEYIGYLREQNQAQNHLLQAALALRHAQINEQNFSADQMFDNDLNLQFLEMGVEVNDFS